MFGDEKSFLNEREKTDKAIDMCAELLFQMDPFARELWVEKYKSSFAYLKKIEDRILVHPPLTNEQKIYIEILEVLFQKYQEYLNDEEFKGENYLVDLYPKSKDKALFEKRLEQIREDFPSIWEEEEEEEEDPINSWDEFYSEFENKFTDDSILLIEFDDTEEVRTHLESLGYMTTKSSNLDVFRLGDFFPVVFCESDLKILIFHKCPVDFNLRKKKSFVKKRFGLNTKLITHIDIRFPKEKFEDFEYKLMEDVDSLMETLGNDLQSIAKKEEGKESVQELKPTSDKAFSDSINEFLMANAAVIISANFWTLAEIKSHVDPDTWEEDPDHLESVISNYNLFTNRDDLLEWINERIDLYKGMGHLDQFLKIGNSENCDYPDAESFLKALDCEYVISVLDICWASACTTKENK